MWSRVGAGPGRKSGPHVSSKSDLRWIPLKKSGFVVPVARGREGADDGASPQVVEAAFHIAHQRGRLDIGAMEVLVRGIGKIIGGSQREERLKVLDRTMFHGGIDRPPLPPTLPPPPHPHD